MRLARPAAIVVTTLLRGAAIAGGATNNISKRTVLVKRGKRYLAKARPTR